MAPRWLRIKLPENIIKKIEASIEGTSWKNVEHFVETLVIKKFSELNKPVYTEEEEELIKERLRKLGYIE